MDLPKKDNEFVFHATDRKGHHAEIRVAIPPEIAQMLDTIMERGKNLPYRTKNDIVRDALYHRLSWLERNRGIDFSGGLQRLKAVDHMINREEAALEFEQRLKRLQATITSIEDEGEVANLVNSVTNEVYQMPNGYWRNRYLTHLKSHYGHFLKPFNMGETE